MEIELIQKYLEGDLNGEALEQFEKRLESDLDLKIEVDLQREMMAHLQLSNDTAAAQSAIAAVHQDYKKEDSETKDINASLVEGPSRRWFLVGVIFLILFMLLFLIRMLSDNDKKETQSLQFAVIPELPEASFMTKGTEDQAFLNEAAVAYNNKQYDEAILKLDQALEAGSSNVGEIQFYKGLSFLGSKKYTQAIALFTSLKEGHPLFAIDADWYIAMSYWYSGNRASAIPILQQFDSRNYQQKAQVYLKHVGQE